MINDEVDQIINELFKSLQKRYQNVLEKFMKDSEFVFNYIYLLYINVKK